MNWTEKIKKVRPMGNFSQYGEEAFINFIFHNINTKNKVFVDIGANDGVWLSNTHNLELNHGWTGVKIDGAHEVNGVHNHFVTRENILVLLEKYNTPKEFDLLSIDIDGNDFWILKEILMNYSPRVIVSEYNAQHLGSKTIRYDPEFVFNADNYYGYTYDAGVKLAEAFGYKIIHQHACLNLFYVKADELPKGEITVDHPLYDWWHDKSDKIWQEI